MRDQSSARNPLVNHTTIFSIRPLMQAQLITSSQTITLPVLIDSGADESIIDWRLAKKLKLHFISLPKSVEAPALDGRLLCRITHSSHSIEDLQKTYGISEFSSV